jgi:hypothetical protein
MRIYNNAPLRGIDDFKSPCIYPMYKVELATTFISIPDAPVIPKLPPRPPQHLLVLFPTLICSQIASEICDPFYEPIDDNTRKAFLRTEY